VERFWSKIEPVGECWEWQASVNAGGYGRFWLSVHEYEMAHRFAYELLAGPIPEGMTLDHLCRNRLCCNPEHLEPVSLAENIRRGAATKTHCPQGHPYDEENTLQLEGRRVCRTCNKERRKEWGRRVNYGKVTHGP
jgi:hypothetical protein